MTEEYRWVAEGGFDAILFDLDGTLVDTESQTGVAIRVVLEGHGVEDGCLPVSMTAGCTWLSIARALLEKYPPLRFRISAEELDLALAENWMAHVGEQVSEIPGAHDAVIAARRSLALGVVSGSPRDLIDRLLESLGVEALIPLYARIGGDNMKASKPAPDGYLMCAERLGVSPARCLVFEDSIAGVKAAKAAGMTCVTVTHSCAELEACLAHSDGAIEHFAQLPVGLWERLAGREQRRFLAAG